MKRFLQIVSARRTHSIYYNLKREYLLTSSSPSRKIYFVILCIWGRGTLGLAIYLPIYSDCIGWKSYFHPSVQKYLHLYVHLSDTYFHLYISFSSVISTVIQKSSFANCKPRIDLETTSINQSNFSVNCCESFMRFHCNSSKRGQQICHTWT